MIKYVLTTLVKLTTVQKNKIKKQPWTKKESKTKKSVDIF